jgi:hypothetical protein
MFASSAVDCGFKGLEYNGGEPYHTNCGNEKRRARIMITCDENVKPGVSYLPYISTKKYIS